MSLKERMANLLESGKARTLAEAYAMAITGYMRKTIKSMAAGR